MTELKLLLVACLAVAAACAAPPVEESAPAEVAETASAPEVEVDFTLSAERTHNRFSRTIPPT